MINSTANTPNVFDVNSLNALKQKVKQSDGNDAESIKASAQQFEALFMQMVLKSMRAATPHEGLMDNEPTRMYESLLDQQLSQVLSSKGKGMGLAAMLEKQFAQQPGIPQPFDGPLPLNPPTPSFRLPDEHRSIPFADDAMPNFIPLDSVKTTAAVGAPPTAAAPAGGADKKPSSSREFVDRVWPAAVEASRQTGIPPKFMVAQAALETGWGKSEPRRADGKPSFNIFGINAGPDWKGPVAESTTIEFVNGVAQKQVKRFRAYESYEESMKDYANLLSNSPRYANVVGTQDAAQFARGLQRAGYATDPMYASKLERIIGGATLRQALS